MIDEDDGLCPCGHEVLDNGNCLVWDEHGDSHEVPRNSRICVCHGVRIYKEWQRT